MLESADSIERVRVIEANAAPYGHPADADPVRFHLIAPYETDPCKWLTLPWIDQYSGKQYRISTTLATSTRQIARVKSYGDVLEEYEFHEEAKCADAGGAPCGKQSIGLLSRRHVRVEKLHFIGKESNKPEEVAEGSASDAGDVYTEYPDPRRDEWAIVIVPKLQQMRLSDLEAQSCLDRRTLQRIRRGQSRPHPSNEGVLRAIAAAQRNGKKSR